MNGIIINVPKGFSGSGWSRNYINIMPMGIFSVANYANKKGHQIQVMNSAVFENKDNAIKTIFNRIEEWQAKIIGIPVHWHLCGYDACCAAEEIKRAFPDVFIVFGGHTATILAEDFLLKCLALDAVICGDGEVPFSSLLSELDKPKSQTNLKKVPNLAWRSGDHIISNELVYVSSSEDLEGFDFSISKSMFDVNEYVNGLGLADVIAGKNHQLSKEKIEDKAFFLNVGRGCSLNCIYCAGSKRSFSHYYKRHTIAIRPVESVIETVRDAVNIGFRKFHVCFDPPFTGHEEYYRNLFTEMKRVSPNLAMMFEFYNLPSKTLLESFSDSFKKALAVISPCFYSEKNMPKYKGYYFSRVEMENCLAEIKRYPNMVGFVFFAITPIDSWDSHACERNIEYMSRLKQKYSCQVSAQPIIAEPGSPWTSFGDLYSDYHIPLTFDNFWDAWQMPLDTWNTKLCRLENVNEIFQRMNLSVAGDSLPEN